MPDALKDELQNIVRLTGNVTDAFTAALFLADTQHDDMLTLRAYQTLSESIIPDVEIPIGRGLIGWVAKNERPTHATNFDRDTKTLQFYSQDEEIKSFAAEPIFDGDRVIGVLSIDSKRQYVFTDKVLKILRDFSVAIAGVITQGKRRIELDSEAVAFETLADLVDKITTCENFTELTNTLMLNLSTLIPHDNIYIAVRSHEEDKFNLVNATPHETNGFTEVDLPLTHYRLGWVIQQGRAFYLPDIGDAPVAPGEEAEWGSFIGAPMMSHNTVTGAIGLVLRKANSFRQVDAKSLSILAAACSSAFANLQLKNKMRKAALKDPLTNTVSHHHLLESHGRLKGEGAVIMVNIAGFTKINLKLGMGGGEAVLVDTANRLNEVVGDGGIVSRFYGDRFIILLRDISKNDVMEKIHAVEEAISGKPFAYKGYEIHVTTAIGATRFPLDGKNVEDLMLKAQAAAEKARVSKTSRISLYGEPEMGQTARLRVIE